MRKKVIETKLLDQWTSLKGLVISIVKDDSLADDVLQTAFIKAFTTTERPKFDSKILPWFKAILRNTALDVLRKQKRTRRKERGTEMQTLVQEQELEKSLCNCVLALMSHLSKSDQDLLKSLDLEELSLSHLSNKMGISKNTLKVRHHRARQRLKKHVMTICKIGSSAECDDCNCS